MTLISIERFYQNTSGTKIKAGIYEDTDPRLKGLGKYLLTNEIATVVEAETPKVSMTITDSNGESSVVETSFDVAIEFTPHAVKLLRENDLDTDSAEDYFYDKQNNYVTKSDAQEFIDYVESRKADE